MLGVQNVSKILSSINVNHTIITIIKVRNPYNRCARGVIVPESQKCSASLAPAPTQSVLEQA